MIYLFMIINVLIVKLNIFMPLLFLIPLAIRKSSIIEYLVIGLLLDLIINYTFPIYLIIFFLIYLINKPFKNNKLKYLINYLIIIISYIFIFKLGININLIENFIINYLIYLICTNYYQLHIKLNG